MRVVLLLVLWTGALVAADHGVSARFVPGQVRPGEVFELRVEMARADYGRFALKVPPHGSLHRVAVEQEPLRLVDGVYRQAESWVLQADRAGEVVMENVVVVLTTDGGETEHVLPPLQLKVVAWGTADESVVPVAFPTEVPELEAGRTAWWWLLAVAGVIGGLVWWLRRSGGEGSVVDPGAEASLEEALGDLEDGFLRSLALEQMLEEGRADWSEALREAVEEAVYAGRGDAGALAVMLKKEVLE